MVAELQNLIYSSKMNRASSHYNKYVKGLTLGIGTPP